MTASHETALASLIDGYQKTAVLYGAVRLQIPELLSAGPQQVPVLAARLGASEDYLRRLLAVVRGAISAVRYSRCLPCTGMASYR